MDFFVVKTIFDPIFLGFLDFETFSWAFFLIFSGFHPEATVGSERPECLTRRCDRRLDTPVLLWPAAALCGVRQAQHMRRSTGAAHAPTKPVRGAAHNSPRRPSAAADPGSISSGRRPRRRPRRRRSTLSAEATVWQPIVTLSADSSGRYSATSARRRRVDVPRCDGLAAAVFPVSRPWRSPFSGVFWPG